MSLHSRHITYGVKDIHVLYIYSRNKLIAMYEFSKCSLKITKHPRWINAI